MVAVRAALVLLIALFAACRNNPTCFGDDECAGAQACIDGECIDPTLADVNWNQNIAPIVAAKCANCHASTPILGAPFPLTSYADTQAVSGGAAIYQRMAARAQDTANPMPPASSPALTQAEIDAIVAWAARGAPQSAMASCDGSMCVVDMGPLTGNESPMLVMNGYTGADGPIWQANNNVVLFVDRGAGQLYQFSIGGAPMAVATVDGRPGGLALDAQGALVVAQSTLRQLGTVAGANVVSRVTNLMGMALNGPDDIVSRDDGTIYFTDPGLDLVEPRELGFNGLFRVPAGSATPVAEWEGLTNLEPNGLTLAPAGNVLYMSDSADAIVRAFDVAQDGALSNERFFVRVQGDSPQGMAADTFGNIWVATSAGVEVYSPRTEYYGTIATAEAATNVAFVGQNANQLCITTVSAVYLTQLSVTGVP